MRFAIMAALGLFIISYTTMFVGQFWHINAQYSVTDECIDGALLSHNARSARRGLMAWRSDTGASCIMFHDARASRL